jgi:hypothetical protein
MRPPMGVLFDAPFGDSLDDLVALSLLYNLDSKNECRVACMTTSKDNLLSAGLYEVYQKIYGGRPAAIGMSASKARGESSSVLKAAMDGQATGVRSVLDTADPHGLMRNMLTAYHDGNAVILCTGTTEHLKDLLQLKTAREVVAAKVKMLYLAGEKQEPVADWPSPVTVIGAEQTKGLTYRPKVEDFAWNEKHPVALALKANPDASLNLAGAVAVLQAVRGKDVTGVDALLSELVGAKPAPRQRPRFGGV